MLFPQALKSPSFDKATFACTTTTCLIIASLLGVAACSSRASEIATQTASGLREGERSIRIELPEQVDDGETSFSSVGLLVVSEPIGDSEWVIIGCSVVLVSDEVALTAAHCFDDEYERDGNGCRRTDPKVYKAFWPTDGFVEIEGRPVIPNEYCPKKIPHGDLAILKLGSRVVVARGAITGSYSDQDAGFLIGFGGHYQPPVSPGLRYLSPMNVRKEHTDPEVDKLSLHSDTAHACHGDSGGAFFVTNDSRQELVGIVSHASTGTVGSESFLCAPYVFVTLLDRFGEFLKSNSVTLQTSAPSQSENSPALSQLGSNGSFELDAASSNEHNIRIRPIGSQIRVSVYGSPTYEGEFCRENIDITIRDPDGNEFCSNNYIGPMESCLLDIDPKWKNKDLRLRVSTAPQHQGCTEYNYRYKWLAIQLR